MIDWDQTAVEDFLAVTADKRVGVVVEFIFDLPLPGGVVQLRVRPAEDHCQFVSQDERACISAHMRIVVNNEPRGGECLVLEGKAGHACVTPGTPHFKLFFSIHENWETREGNEIAARHS